MKKKSIILSYMFLCLWSVAVYGQSSRGFFASLEAGALFANKYTANYYNGTALNLNPLSYVFFNQYWIEDIKREVGGYQVIGYQMPTKMKYKVSTSIGGRLGYSLNEDNGVFIKFSYARLHTADVLKINIDSVTHMSEKAYRLGYLVGEEGRSTIDIGYLRRFRLSNNFRFNYEMGISITSTKIIASDVQIGSFKQSLFNRGNYVPGTELYDPITQVYTGFGAFIGGNFEMLFGNWFSMDLGLNVYYQSLNFHNYEKFVFSFLPSLKLNFFFLRF